jgi:DNA-binding transcriptional regulator YhcF (GntR family)
MLREEGYLKLDRRKGAIVSVEVNSKERELTKINDYMQMIVAQAICKEITREEMNRMVDEMYDAFRII